MALHARKQIRAAIALRLEEVQGAWTKVFQSRIPPTRAQPPYLMVFFDRESAEGLTAVTEYLYARTAQLVIVGRVRIPGNGETETVEDLMDAMALSIESKLTLTNLRADSVLIQTLRMQASEMNVVLSQDEAPSYGELMLSYAVDYVTQEAVPETLI